MSKDWEKFFEQGIQAFEADRLEQAESLFKAALAAAEDSENQLDVAICSEKLGELYFETQRYREAEPCFKRTLAIRDGMLKPHDDLVVAALNNLSALYFFEGNHELAEEPCKRLTEIYEQVLGPENPEVATARPKSCSNGP